jgi:hypothetical protein
MHLIQGVEIVNTEAVFPAPRFQYADQLFASVMGDHQYDSPIRLETKASRRVFKRSAWLKSTLKIYRGFRDRYYIESIVGRLMTN